MVMNGARLGTFQSLVNSGYTRSVDGRSDPAKTILAGAFSGTVGGALGSPLYLVRVHAQPA
jgi:hypothetical protein